MPRPPKPFLQWFIDALSHLFPWSRFMAIRGYDQSVLEGILRAHARYLETAPNANMYSIDRGISHSRDLLLGGSARNDVQAWSRPSQVLFAEIVTLGAIARAVREESPSPQSDIKDFADWVRKILNDWTKK